MRLGVIVSRVAIILLIDASTYSTSKSRGGEDVSQVSTQDMPVEITFEVLKHERRDQIPPISRTTPGFIKKKLDGHFVSIEGYLNPCLTLQRYTALGS
jgi:hypothetical protein